MYYAAAKFARSNAIIITRCSLFFIIKNAKVESKGFVLYKLFYPNNHLSNNLIIFIFNFERAVQWSETNFSKEKNNRDYLPAY